MGREGKLKEEGEGRGKQGRPPSILWGIAHVASLKFQGEFYEIL